MDYLSIDFETFSTVDLRKTGVYPYANHPDTGILCMSYLMPGEDEVRTWVPVYDEPFPDEVDAYLRAALPLRAWNAQFERVIWALVLGPQGIPVPPRQHWYDTMADAAALALPLSLMKCAEAVGVDQQKDVDGHRLMRSMSKPRKNGTFWHEDPEEGPDRMDALIRYCEQDVRTEVALHRVIPELSRTERKVYLLDQTINDRGVGVDLDAVRAAQKIAKAEKQKANKEIAELTDGDVTAVTKVKDMTEWLQLQGADIDNLRKDTVRDLLGEDFPEDVRRVIELRAEVAKTSTSKLKSMLAYAGDTGRARGMLQYHGASTGRWSGRGPQPQNYPRPEIKNAESYIDRLDEVETWDHPPMIVISSALRSMLRAAPGKLFVSGDFSQIEARVTAWFAGQEDQLEIFRNDGLIYEAMAAKIYGIHHGQISKDSKERQIGKMAILGAGFGMGWETFIKQTKKMTGIELSEEEGRRAIDAYRDTNHRIQSFWYEIEDCAKKAISKPGRTVTYTAGPARLRFKVAGQFLWVELPSGRRLAYALPRIEQKMKPWGEPGPTITYMGMNGYTRKWERMTTYGGKLTENVVQAHARDLMAHAMLRLDPHFPVVLTVHDEILSEVPEKKADLDRFIEIMQTIPDWSAGVPVKAEGWVGRRYRK